MKCPNCVNCGKGLEDAGAILLSPFGRVLGMKRRRRDHLCQKCYEELVKGFNYEEEERVDE